MVSEYEGMSLEADLLSLVLDHGGITVKSLAMEFQRDQSVIYRYLSGERTLPVGVLRSAFKLTGDLRLPYLITGENLVLFHIKPGQEDNKPGGPTAESLRIPPVRQWMPRTCDSLEKAAKATKYVGEIMQDGIFTRDDLPAAHNLKRHICDAIRDLSVVGAAVDHEIRKVSTGRTA